MGATVVFNVGTALLRLVQQSFISSAKWLLITVFETQTRISVTTTLHAPHAVGNYQLNCRLQSDRSLPNLNIFVTICKRR